MSRMRRGLLSRCRIDIPEKALECRLVLGNKLADQVPGSLEVPTIDDNLVPEECAAKAVVLVLLPRRAFRRQLVPTLARLRQHPRNPLFRRLDGPPPFSSPLPQFPPS